MNDGQQLTPDHDFAGNELICEKLLRWKRSTHKGDFFQQWFDRPCGDDGAQWHTRGTPSFSSWAEAGLILDALSATRKFPRIGQLSSGAFYAFACGNAVSQSHETLPLAIRAAALEYIRGLP